MALHRAKKLLTQPDRSARSSASPKRPPPPHGRGERCEMCAAAARGRALARRQHRDAAARSAPAAPATSSSRPGRRRAGRCAPCPSATGASTRASASTTATGPRCRSRSARRSSSGTRSSARLVAFYPSPAGATESLLASRRLARPGGANPILAELEPDVEALLVHARRGEPLRVLPRAHQRLLRARRTGAPRLARLRRRRGGLERHRRVLRRAARAAARCRLMIALSVVTGARVEPFAAVPTLVFDLAITSGGGAPIESIALRCQIRIEPQRRRYTPAEEARLRRALRRDAALGRHAQAVPVDPRRRWWSPASPARRRSSCRCRAPTTSTWRRRSTSTRLEDDARSRRCSCSRGTVFARGEAGLRVQQVPWDKEARLPPARRGCGASSWTPTSPAAAGCASAATRLDALIRFKARARWRPGTTS